MIFSVQRPEHQLDQWWYPAVGVFGQDFCFVDGPEYGIVPSLVAAGLLDAPAGDGAIGCDADFHFGAWVTRHVTRVSDIGFDTTHQATCITGRGA